MGNTLTIFHYDNIIQNYQQLQMLQFLIIFDTFAIHNNTQYEASIE